MAATITYQIVDNTIKINTEYTIKHKIATKITGAITKIYIDIINPIAMDIKANVFKVFIVVLFIIPFSLYN